MTKLLVYFECDPAQIGDIIGSIGSNMALVRNLRIETEERATKPKQVRGKQADIHSDYKDMGRSRVIQAMFAALKEAGSKGCTRDHFRRVMTKNNLAANSFSPALSFLLKEGLVGRTPNDRFVLIKVLQEQAEAA